MTAKTDRERERERERERAVLSVTVDMLQPSNNSQHHTQLLVYTVADLLT